jgi:argininosuccinate lyase
MTKKLWGGRFGAKTDPLVEDFTRSIGYDYKLAACDIIGSIVHVEILEKSGLLETRDAQKLVSALKKIYDDVADGTFSFDGSCEDIHTNIQNAVEKSAGDVALKLHTARSRNDQVLFDVKLFCAFGLDEVKKLCETLQASLQKAAKALTGVIIPGYTHLQHAQLVYLSDYLNGYTRMLERDCTRLEHAKNGIQLTLGAGALAGTPIDASFYHKELREIIGDAKDLKVTPTTNALDAVSDRDFVVETLSALAVIGMHLSRLAEDLIIWSTKEFGFAEIDDAFATGSSLMPQKKNPDVLELIRGSTGILYGNLMSILTTLKGLPLAYNRDMQVDKPPLFSSFEIVTRELKVLPGLIRTIRWNRKRIDEVVSEDETLYATDLVYYLIGKGVPFKEAHDMIGKLVTYSLSKGKKISKISDKELKQFSNKMKQSEIKKVMDPDVSVKSRISVDRSHLKPHTGNRPV